MSEIQTFLKKRINEIQKKIFGIVTETSIFIGQKRHTKYERESFSSFEKDWEALKRNYSAILRAYKEKQEYLDSFKRFLQKKIKS